MNLLDKIAVTMGYKKIEKSVGPLQDNKTINLSLRQILSTQGTSVKYPYKQSIWVFSCVNAIMTNIARVPFVLKKDAGTLEPGIIESGELYDLFQNPNPYSTQEELIRDTIGYLALKGEAFWILEGRTDVTTIPKEIWTFNPDRFITVTDKNTGMLLGWKYRGADDIYFEEHEIIHFKTFNPYDDFRGLSPLEAAQLSVEQDFGASTYNKAFFENGATIGGVISIPDELTQEQFTRLVQQFEDRHQGASKAHKVAVVEGGGKFVPLRISQKDMDFVEGKNITRKEILAAFNVNEVVLGDFTSVKSYQGGETAHKAFWEECLMPKMIYFENLLWSKLFSKIGQRRGKGRIWAEFDTANVGPLQEDYGKKITMAHTMFNMGWPINMINKRLQLGMKEVPWGDEWWVPGGYLPVDTLRNAAPPNQNPPTDPKKDPKETAPKKEEYEFYYSVLEDEFKSKFTKTLFNVRKRVLACFFETKTWNSVLQDSDYNKLKEGLEKIYLYAAHNGAAVKQKELNNFSSFEFENYAKDKSEILAKEFYSLISIIIDKMKDIDNVESIREIFNFIAVKADKVACDEARKAFSYGVEKAIEGSEKEIVLFIKQKLLE